MFSHHIRVQNYVWLLTIFYITRLWLFLFPLRRNRGQRCTVTMRQIRPFYWSPCEMCKWAAAKMCLWMWQVGRERRERWSVKLCDISPSCYSWQKHFTVTALLWMFNGEDGEAIMGCLVALKLWADPIILPEVESDCVRSDTMYLLSLVCVYM